MIRHSHRRPRRPRRPSRPRRRRRPAGPAGLRHGDVLVGDRLPEATHVPRGLR